MAKIVWTEPALDDLRQIIDFIAQDSPIYAERIGIQLVEAPRRLEPFPLCGRIVPEFADKSIRELIYGSYRVIYQCRQDACCIVAVVHASRNILLHVNPDELSAR